MGTGPARDEGPARPDPACGQQDRNAVGRPSATAQILSPTDRTGNRRRVIGSGQNSLQRVRARADRSDHARAARLHDGRGSADDRSAAQYGQRHLRIEAPVAPEIDPGLHTDGQDRRMDNRRHPDRLDPDRPRSDGPAARTGSFGGAGVARVQGHDFGLRRIDPALGSGHDKARRLDRDAVERSGRGRQRNQR